MSTGGSNSAIYEAILIDKITPAAQQIMKTLEELHDALEKTNKPAEELNKNLSGVGKALQNVKQNADANPLHAYAKGLQSAQRATFVVGQAIGNFVQQIGQAARTAGVAGMAIGAGLAAAFGKASQLGAEVEDSLQFFDQVFGENAQSMRQWVREYTDAMNASEYATVQFASMFKSFLGKGQSDPEKMVKNMIGWANDLKAASPQFRTLDEAAKLLQSFIAGENLALQRVGIKLMQKDLEDLSKTLYGIDYNNLTSAQRQFLRYKAAEQALADSGILGQAAREVSQFGSTMRGIWADLYDSVANFGMALNRVMKPIVSSIKGITQAVSELSESFKFGGDRSIQQMLGGILGLISTSSALVALGTVLAALGGAILVVTGLVTALLAAAAAITLAWGTVALPIGALVVGLSALAAAFATVFAFMTVRNFPIAQAFEDAKQTAQNLFSVVQDGFKALSAAIRLEDWTTAWKVLEISAEMAFINMRLALFIALGEMVEAAITAAWEIGQALDPRNWGKGGGFNLFDSGPLVDRYMKLQNELTKIQLELNRRLQEEGKDPFDPGDNDVRPPPGSEDGGQQKFNGSFLGTTSAAVAANNAAFLPVMNPLLSEAKMQTQIQKQMNEHLAELANGGLLFQ